MSGNDFKWHRPRLMGTTDFEEFKTEVEERVGVENAALLKDIDKAINTDGRMPRYLEITEDEARSLAASSGTDEKKFFFYLAVLNEIEFRKAKGPAIWERRRAVVPCPDFLPPTKWQIRAGSMGVYNVLGKIWNVSLVVVVAGVIPFMLVPLSNFMTLGNGIDISDPQGLSLFSVVSFFSWIFFVLLFTVTFAISRYMRNKR